jgi:hypothetical protein
MRAPTRTLLAAFVLAAAVGSGCGSSSSDLPQRTIAFDGPRVETARTRDMRRAAQLEIDAIHGDTKGSRLQMAKGYDNRVIASIDAFSPLPPRQMSQPRALIVSLSPPDLRSTTERVTKFPQVWLMPPTDVAKTALDQYRASGATGAASARLDSPTQPGTPTGQYVTAGMSAHSYPPAGSDFFKKFVDKYGHAPDRYAIYAYEAVGLIVDAIDRLEAAGKPVTQQSVAESALSIRNRYSPVGHYDLLPSGQSTLYLFQARGGEAPTGQASLIEALR